MAKAKKQLKQLKKFAEQLNDLELADEIDLDQDQEDLQEEFITTIEELDDEGKTAEIDDEILDFFESLIPDDDDGDEDEEEEEKPKKAKKGKKGKKAKGKKGKKGKKKKDKEPEPEEEPEEEEEPETPAIDLEAIEEEIEEMDFDELEEWCEEKEVPFDYDEDDDDEEDIVADILKHYKKLAKKAKKGKKGKKGKKAKGKKGKAKKEKKAKGTPIQDLVVDSLSKYKGKKVQLAKVTDEVITARKKEGSAGADGIVKQYVKVMCYALTAMGYATGDDDTIKLKK